MIEDQPAYEFGEYVDEFLIKELIRCDEMVASIQPGMTEDELVDLLKEVNSILLVASESKEAYLSYKYHLFVGADGSYTVIQGKEIPIDVKPNGKSR